jgi:hypothetical protein
MGESGPACLFNKRHSNAFSSWCGNWTLRPRARYLRFKTVPGFLYFCPSLRSRMRSKSSFTSESLSFAS